MSNNLFFFSLDCQKLTLRWMFCLRFCSSWAIRRVQ